MPYTPADYGDIVTGAFREQFKEEQYVGPKGEQPPFYKEGGITLVFLVFMYFFMKVFFAGLGAVFFGSSC